MEKTCLRRDLQKIELNLSADICFKNQRALGQITLKKEQPFLEHSFEFLALN